MAVQGNQKGHWEEGRQHELRFGPTPALLPWKCLVWPCWPGAQRQGLRHRQRTGSVDGGAREALVLDADASRKKE